MDGTGGAVVGGGEKGGWSGGEDVVVGVERSGSKWRGVAVGGRGGGGGGGGGGGQDPRVMVVTHS